jgi:hypothetical protein
MHLNLRLPCGVSAIAAGLGRVCKSNKSACRDQFRRRISQTQLIFPEFADTP